MGTEITITYEGKYVNGYKEYLKEGTILLFTTKDEVIGKGKFIGNNIVELSGVFGVEKLNDSEKTIKLKFAEEGVKVSKLLYQYD